MGNGIKIGVVTVTYDSSQVIEAFMESMLRQTYHEFILYVVDNTSSDDTLKLVSNWRDSRLVIVRNTVNVGVAEGNNIGIRRALNEGCASVLLINNDTVFDSDLLLKLHDGLETFQCHMAVPKILFFDRPDTIWSAGGYFSRIRGSTKHLGYEHMDDGRFDQPRAVAFSSTCCMLIKREVFERIGLMDANYFVYFDDTDFCLRAHRAGLTLFYVPAARLLHKVSSLTGKEPDVSFRYLIRNHIYYMLKNFPPWQILYYLPAFQMKILAKFIIWRPNPRAFFAAEKALAEGISLFVRVKTFS